MDEQMEAVQEATLLALEAVHQITDRMLDPVISRGVLLGVAATMIARNLGEDELNAEAVNRAWKEMGFAWRMVPLQ